MRAFWMRERAIKAVQDLGAAGPIRSAWVGAHHSTFPGLLFLLEPEGGAAAGSQRSNQEPWAMAKGLDFLVERLLCHLLAV